MAMHWNTFFTRLGSAIIFSAIMMAGLLWNNEAFLILAIAIMLLCLKEYFPLTKKVMKGHRYHTLSEWGLALAGVLMCVALYEQILVAIRPVLFASIAWCSLVVLLAMLMAKGTLEHAAIVSSALVYIILPILCFIALRQISLILPLALILMIWMNDTMAYLVGSFIGKTPFNSISPKKTWEGTIGGVVLTIAGAALWGYYSPYYQMQDWIALSLCASIAGTAGDLFESKLKREAGVKDSGHLMPGHGGALDRFDSLLFAVPFAFAYAWLFMPSVPLKIF